MLFFGMRRDLRIRKTRTASGVTAVQVVRYEDKRRHVVSHIGRATDENALAVLFSEAKRYVQTHEAQPSLFDTVGAEADHPQGGH